MTDYLQTITDVRVADSKIHGTGLFTTRPRKRGEVLTVLDGQAVPHNENIDFLLKYEWNAINVEEILLRPVWTLYGLINHDRPAVLSFQLIDHTLRLVKDIASGTELTLDYCEHGIPECYLNSDEGSYLR